MIRKSIKHQFIYKQTLVTKSYGIMGLLLVDTMLLWPLILLRREVSLYCAMLLKRILKLITSVPIKIIN